MISKSFLPDRKASYGCRIGLIKYLLTLFTTFALVQSAFSADSLTFADEWLLSKPNSDEADYAVYQAAGVGWFENLGPTGIRAMLTDTLGRTVWLAKGIRYNVKYIFPNSPASGKVQVGDIIIGVNGKRFQTPYVFGYWWGFGYTGPLTEFGRAVEVAESQKNGVLDIMLLRNGSQTTVSVQLPLTEAFSTNWPYNCPKSVKLKQGALAYILSSQKSDGSWPGTAAHTSVFPCLALMAQGNQYLPQVKKHLDKMINSFNDYTWNWVLAMYGILMAEYDIATNTTTYVPSMKVIDSLFVKNRRFKNGTYGHEGNAGSDGYGPMCGLTSLVAIGWAMLQKAGIAIHEAEWKKTMETLDMELTVDSTDHELGAYGYGWPNLGAAVYTFSPSKITPVLDQLNVDITTYNNQRAATITRGYVVLTHAIKPWQSYSPQIATQMINQITRTRRCVVTGHGSGMMHAMSCFLALGNAASRGNMKPLRLTLDDNLDLLNSSRCTDGSFYTQPIRDDYGGDFGYGSRILPTALWALVLSIPDANLVLLGKGSSSIPSTRAAPATIFGIHASLHKNSLFITATGYRESTVEIRNVQGVRLRKALLTGPGTTEIPLNCAPGLFVVSMYSQNRNIMNKSFLMR